MIPDKVDRAARFTSIYESNEWNSSETRSGRGSDLSATEQVVRIIDLAIMVSGARTLLDVGCGECHWMEGVRAPIEHYIGVDIVDRLAKSAHLGKKLPSHWKSHQIICADLVCDPLPECDLILCRDVLPHFSNETILLALENMFNSNARYLLTTSFAKRTNQDIETGLWRPINLEAPPFNLPTPSKRWYENCPLDGGKYLDKCLNLWHVEELNLP